MTSVSSDFSRGNRRATDSGISPLVVVFRDYNSVEPTEAGRDRGNSINNYNLIVCRQLIPQIRKTAISCVQGERSSRYRHYPRRSYQARALEAPLVILFKLLSFINMAHRYTLVSSSTNLKCAARSVVVGGLSFLICKSLTQQQPQWSCLHRPYPCLAITLAGKVRVNSISRLD